MTRRLPVWVAPASRILAGASSRSPTFVAGSQSWLRIESKEKTVSARRLKSEPDWHLHAGRVRYPMQFAAQ